MQDDSHRPGACAGHLAGCVDDLRRSVRTTGRATPIRRAWDPTAARRRRRGRHGRSRGSAGRPGACRGPARRRSAASPARCTQFRRCRRRAATARRPSRPRGTRCPPARARSVPCASGGKCRAVCRTRGATRSGRRPCRPGSRAGRASAFACGFPFATLPVAGVPPASLPCGKAADAIPGEVALPAGLPLALFPQRRVAHDAGCTHVDEPQPDALAEMHGLRAPTKRAPAAVLAELRPVDGDAQLEAQVLFVGDVRRVDQVGVADHHRLQDGPAQRRCLAPPGLPDRLPLHGDLVERHLCPVAAGLPATRSRGHRAGPGESAGRRTGGRWRR